MEVGLEPACIKACPTNCLHFGTKEQLVQIAQARVGGLKERGYEKAGIYDPEGRRPGLLRASLRGSARGVRASPRPSGLGALLLWKHPLKWGHASSPVVYEDLVIVQADVHKGSFLAAYEVATGKEVWRTARDEIPTWGSPTVYRGPPRPEVITNGTTIRAYDPRTGRLLWWLGPNSEITVATPVAADGLVFVTAGYPPVRPIYAIRPGGSGDLSLPDGKTSSEWVAWSHDRGGTYIPTPIVYEDQLYTLDNNGRVVSYRAGSGEVIYCARVGGIGGSYAASPVAADGRLFFTSETGEVHVVRAGPRYEELARNEMHEVCMATPAISDGLLVIRTLNHLYGIGEPAGAEADPEL